MEEAGVGVPPPPPSSTQGRKKMRKAVMMMALVALFTLVAAGVAVALTRTCTAVPCKGTSAADFLRERVGNGRSDVIYGFQQNDRLRAERYTRDTDYLYRSEEHTS